MPKQSSPSRGRAFIKTTASSSVTGRGIASTACPHRWTVSRSAFRWAGMTPNAAIARMSSRKRNSVSPISGRGARATFDRN